MTLKTLIRMSICSLGTSYRDYQLVKLMLFSSFYTWRSQKASKNFSKFIQLGRERLGLLTIKLIVKVKLLSCVQLFVTPWTVAYQASPSMEFSRHEYWTGLPLPTPGDLPDPGIEPRSPALQTDTLPSELPGNLPGKEVIDIKWYLSDIPLRSFKNLRYMS